MAIAIKTIPTLKGKVAQQFNAKAKAMLKQKGTIDFSKQVKITNAILSKAKF